MSRIRIQQQSKKKVILGGGVSDIFLPESFYPNTFLVQPYDSIVDPTFTPTDLGAKLDTWIDPVLIDENDFIGDDLDVLPDYNGNDFLYVDAAEASATSGQIGIGSGQFQDPEPGKFIGSNNRQGFGGKVFGDLFSDHDVFQHPSVALRQTTLYERSATVVNPSYVEGFFVVSKRFQDTTETLPSLTGGIIWAHRSEATRLIQVGYDYTNKLYQLQIRGSGGVIQTLQAPAIEYSGIDIIHFRFDAGNDDHFLNVNGIFASSSYDFGSETFNSLHEVISGYYGAGAGQNQYARGFEGFLYEGILCKGSNLTDVEIKNVLRYLENKYLWEQ